MITARKLPAILAFLDFAGVQRTALCAGHWIVKFGRAYARIGDQILPACASAAVAEARAALASKPAGIYLPPEALL